MGRAPCCDKAKVKKGPWSPEEDAKLKSYIEQHGTGGNWIALPQKIGLQRCGKSCRLRWLNYLRPNIKHGGFSEEEDNIICSLYISIGSRWSIIAAQLPGRTDNDIKNYWNTRLKKKLLGKQRKEQRAARRVSCLKQEIKEGSENSTVVVADHNNQNSFWLPELPVLPPIPYSNQEPRLNDHTSIRKLLIKLGGRFSDNNQPIQSGTTIPYPIVENSSSQQIHQQPENMLNSTHASTLNNPNFQYMEGTGFNMLQGQNSTTLPVELEQMAYTNTNGADGLEFLYADDLMMNYTIGSGYGEEISMGNMGEYMSSSVYPSVVSSYEDLQLQIMEDQCSFVNELTYAGAQ